MSGSKLRALKQHNSQLLFSSASLARFMQTICAMTSY